MYDIVTTEPFGQERPWQFGKLFDLVELQARRLWNELGDHPAVANNVPKNDVRAVYQGHLEGLRQTHRYGTP